MSWSALAEARIQEWLRKPTTERASHGGAGGEPRPLELELFDRLGKAREGSRKTGDPLVRAELEEHARGIETQLFALLDATGRSVLAPLWAERMHALRRGDAAWPGT